MIEKGKVRTITHLFKFEDPDGAIYKALRAGAPIELFLDRLIERRTIEGNIFLTEGINFIWNCIATGSCSPPFNSSNACIGVGDGTASENASQTGLQGSNKFYKQVDSGYPTISGNKITFRATFGSNDANFTWNEWTVANQCSDNGVNLNRKVQNLGTKASGTTWVLQVELSIS